MILKKITILKLARFKSTQTAAPTTYYVTTPIYYVNAKPHIGHLYSSLIADAAQRWQRIKHPLTTIKFATGCDEHGTKIQQAATQHNTNPKQYCDRVMQQYKHLSDLYSIEYTDFMRTSDERHHDAVQWFWTRLASRGYVEKRQYSGWYSVSDETFLTESQLKEAPDGKTRISAESGHPVEWSEEVNYVFPLSRVQADVKNWLTRQPDRIKPARFYKQTLDILESGALPDISISRPIERVHWAVKVPQDPSQTVYVWLDALINYVTACSTLNHQNNVPNSWPADLHVIGKDILKFHAIYWPAFLIAADLEPPRRILCHSHWTVDGEKMSKSKGNTVCPIEGASTYTADGFRYFLLREGVAHSDGNYTSTKIGRILNAELADTLGNLLSRCTGRALNPHSQFPGIDPDIFEQIKRLDSTRKLIASLRALPHICEAHYDDYNYYKVADSVFGTLQLSNAFFEALKPWQLKKAGKLDELYCVLHITMEALRVCGVLLQPLVPTISASLLNKLGVVERDFESVLTVSWDDFGFSGRDLLEQNEALFKRML